MMSTHIIDPTKELTFEHLNILVRPGTTIELSDEAIKKIEKCRAYLDKTVKDSVMPVYGVNTGFGSLYKKNIPAESLTELQVNLVRSHACGAGREIPSEIVRLMLALKVQSLSYGHSGVQLVTVQRLIDMFNAGICPVVYEFGSLGASGDLAPLAHLSLPLIGEGEVILDGERISGAEMNRRMGWEPVAFKSKEGLALLNGTQFMSAFGVYCLMQARRLSIYADRIGALSLDAFDGRLDPFEDLIHIIRPQAGQRRTAEAFRKLLKDSEMMAREKKHVQDPYSFRCIPQVHGASKDAIRYVESVFLAEINGVTDNPNIFPDEDRIISGGNFHGQPLAMALDFLAIGLAELGSISERRTFQLVSGNRELPDFLVANPGLNSGLMIPQYTAASIVSRNKQLCTPASVDSIVSSNGQEDHVSMGANAATKTYEVVNNLYSILAIECMCASQALSFREEKTSPFLQEFADNFREKVSFIDNDRIFREDIRHAEEFLKEYTLNSPI
ncbi:histidine ammonia-lyase [Roseivirga sp. BDSF3-8]|uniref:histidine ammonia-lyase n=1 Tax=Roseivirga sp. BDSF3-8 TaxID=3241598 RepID=UPI0035326A73